MIVIFFVLAYMSKSDNKLLIVDDLKLNRMVIEALLDFMDIEIHHACSGRDALSKILEHDYAVILMDVNMPELDGYETTRLILDMDRFSEIPIIIITANDNTKSNYIKAYQAGAVDYVTKPVEPIVLISKVRQFVKMYEQRRAIEISEQNHEKVSSRMQGLLNAAAEGIIGIDNKGLITFANPKAGNLLEEACLVGRWMQDFFTSENELHTNIIYAEHKHQGNIIETLQKEYTVREDTQQWCTAAAKLFHVEYSCEIIRNLSDVIEGAVITFQDVTERKEIEHKLIRLANYDPLTNLANRAYFHDSLVRGIARTKRNKGKLAVFFLDLDHFKNINDNLGHDAGDLLLRVVGERLTAGIRAGDIAARIGGDEFAIILHDVDSIHHVIKVADKIIKLVHKPVELGGMSITTSTSIGIALYEKSMSVVDLVKAADIAMYAAKNKGRNNYQFFETEMQKKAAEKSKIQSELTEAIVDGVLSVYYQPKVSIVLDKVIGMEALVRWETSEGNFISPDLFIPLAEESGQIHELGEYILRKVCRQIKQWNEIPGFEGITISVNVSALQLKAGNFHHLVKSILLEYEIEPSQLELELTETAVMSDADLAERELQLIHDLGVHISIDDFGTGYSSLSYLKKFPIDLAYSRPS